MDFKKLFKNNDKAVSPVIGVILMVAITVILAAAIGSAVFGHGTAQPAPQANLDIQSASVANGGPVSVIIEHMAGDPIHFETNIQTKVMASVDGDDSVEIIAMGLNTMSVGDVNTLPLTAVDSTNTPNVNSGQTVNLKIIDVATNQLICDKNVRF